LLKTKREGETWLVTQPNHAMLAGLMAAHWGNLEFARPGEFAPSANAAHLRREFEFAVTQHDNGWWEWEADPTFSPEDGLPQGLADVLRDPVEGMKRWRIGVPRLADAHPYASLLISFHAYWLYASQFLPDAPEVFRHQLQRRSSAYPKEIEQAGLAFLEELRFIQQGLVARIGGVEQLEPHVRLLQFLDGLSLYLCAAVIAPLQGPPKGLGNDHVRFENVPRASWEDRVAIEAIPMGGDRIRLEPYPFDIDPMPVSVPARRVAAGQDWNRTTISLLEYQFTAG
jgi:hypothetical protein